MATKATNPYACPECDGAGIVECPHCDQDMDCEVCDGSGLDHDRLDYCAYSVALNALAVTSGHKRPSPWVENGIQLGMQTGCGKVAFADYSQEARKARREALFATDAGKLEWKLETVSIVIYGDKIPQEMQRCGPYAVADDGKLYHVGTGFSIGRNTSGVNEAKALAYTLHAAGHTPKFEDWNATTAEDKQAIKKLIDEYLRYEPLEETKKG